MARYPSPIALLLAAASLAQCQDVIQILTEFVDAQNQNAKRASQYTYVEENTSFSYDKNGQLKKGDSETNEIIFVEGEEYKKLVARNGMPLSAKEQASVDKKLKQTAEERRKQRRNGLFHHEYSYSPGSGDDLLKLLDSRLLGEEEVRGRKAWVIECTPPPGRVPANQHQVEVLSFGQKFWIDQEEKIPLRMVQTVVGDRLVLKPGTIITSEYDKIDHDAWLPVSIDADVRAQVNKLMKDHSRSEVRNSNFQKFDVQSTITIDPPK